MARFPAETARPSLVSSSLIIRPTNTVRHQSKSPQQALHFRIKLPEAFAGSCETTETTPIEWPNVSRVLEHISLGVVPSPTSRVPCSGLQPTKPPSHFTAANPSVEGDNFRAPLTTQISFHQWQHGGHGQEFKSDAHPDLGRSALQRVAECAASYRNDKRTASELNCREVMPDHCTHGRPRKKKTPTWQRQNMTHDANALVSLPNNRTLLRLSDTVTRSLVPSIPRCPLKLLRSSRPRHSKTL